MAQPPVNSRDLTLAASILTLLVTQLKESDPAFSEDSQLLIDTLEGETEFLDKIDLAFEAVSDLEANAETCAARIKVLGERKSRMTARAEDLRTGLIRVLQVMGEPSWKRATYTATVNKARESVEITGLDELPQGFYKNERKADKGAIKTALDAKQLVPGAKLSTGNPSLTIRNK
jgi:Siphovirus Gp157